MACKCM